MAKKSEKMSDENKVGRPSKYSEAVVGKLEIAFRNDFNVQEACDFAEINRDTFYEWIKNKPEFSDRMEAAKSHPKRMAKMKVIKAIEEGDVDVAKWFLERRAKEEYAPKHEMAVGQLNECKDKLDEMIEELRSE